jgi:hypothetical protein
MNVLVFTLCSKNYLGQATTFYDSFKQHNPDIITIIGVVDKLYPEEKERLSGYEFLEVDTVGHPSFADMKSRYTIVELNTAVKPYYIKYFFDTRKNIDKVIYFDPDVYFFNNIGSIENNLDKFDFILTPHFSNPVYDKYWLSEKVVLNTGIFNLGFFAIKRSDTANKLLDWWCRKLYDECIHDLSNGYFVDQLWMNLSVCHFDNYVIDKNPGLNAAHWNFHERNFNFENDKWLVNGQYELIFFHYSTYKPDTPTKIADWQNRFTFATRPDIVPLFDTYKAHLVKNNYAYFKALKPIYGIIKKEKKLLNYFIRASNYLKRKIITSGS